MTKFKTPRGTRDFLPEDMIVRKKIISIIESTFRKYGFSSMDTPIFENYEVFNIKGGGGAGIEGDIFKFEDKKGRKMGLRYDLTVPSARVVATNQQLPMPFKRYNMGPVWRYERPQKGRYREFWQCDVDVYGTDSMLAEAECLACVTEALKNLGFSNFYVRINDRELLDFLIKKAGVPDAKKNAVFRIIDKLDKIEKSGVEKMLSKEVSKEAVKKVMKLISISGEPRKMIKRLKDLGVNSKLISKMDDLFDYISMYNVDAKLSLDLSLVRGLEYYTGPIFEIVTTKMKIGSIAGGGRYDNLLELYGRKRIPAVGISIGIERVIDVMKENNMIDIFPSETEVFVASTGESMIDEAIRLAQALRNGGFRVETDLSSKGLSKQLNYANTNKIRRVIIVGEKGMKKREVTIKDMTTGTENTVKIAEIFDHLSPRTIM